MVIAPLSGAGAARQGGRATRQGVEALYTSLDDQTALLEYQQESPLMPPGTLNTISVGLPLVLNFSAPFEVGEGDPLWQDFFCDWREQRFINISSRRAGSLVTRSCSERRHSCAPRWPDAEAPIS